MHVLSDHRPQRSMMILMTADGSRPNDLIGSLIRRVGAERLHVAS